MGGPTLDINSFLSHFIFFVLLTKSKDQTLLRLVDFRVEVAPLLVLEAILPFFIFVFVVEIALGDSKR